MACEQNYWNQMYANACDQSAPSLLWRPQLFIDGHQWCALYGYNLQDGVAGFGDTPDKAMRNFDLNWREQALSRNYRHGTGGSKGSNRGASTRSNSQ